MLAKAISVLAFLLVLAPSTAHSFHIRPFFTEISVTTSIVGNGQIVGRTYPGGTADDLVSGVYLPAGDPFSAASISIEFTVADPTVVLFFGSYPLIDVGGYSNLPWDVTVAFARLGPNPELLVFEDEGIVFPTVDDDGWIDTSFVLDPGRYRVFAQALQVGGAVPASVGFAVRGNPIPEPSAALLFALGLVVARRERGRRGGSGVVGARGPARPAIRSGPQRAV